MKATDEQNADAAEVADAAGAMLPPKISVATQLVQLAKAMFELKVTPDAEAFAVPIAGAKIPRLLRGGRHSIRGALASAYFEATGCAAAQSALADACGTLEGQAQRLDAEPLHLRVAEHQGQLVLDLGTADGRCVLISSTGWRVAESAPVWFRRTALTGALPEPVGGSDFTELWTALNVAERHRPLVLAVLVASLRPNIPHPVVLLTGEQGTGKSTAATQLASIVDPSPAQLRKPPRDVEQWTTAAAGGWVVALDNLSGIPDWLSDALCRASTGDGDVRRRLYTDGDLAVFAFRRCVIVNGIDLGALRGDLADRLVHLQLEQILASTRRRDEQLATQWRAAHPQVLGALLDLTVKVLAALPTITRAELPRMADFALVLAAVDQVNGTTGFDTYTGLRDELASDAATSDPVLVAITGYITEEFTGTSADLLEMITPRGMAADGWKPPKGWPASARALTTALTRNAPTLRQLGWMIQKVDRDADRSKLIRWHLKPPEPPSESKSAEHSGGQEPPSESKSADQEPTDGGCNQREPVNDAADAALPHDHESSQVNEGAASAATSAATCAASPPVAAGAASPPVAAPVAAQVAAPSTPILSSGNEDHAANAATAASITGLLPSPPATGGETPPPITPAGLPVWDDDEESA